VLCGIMNECLVDEWMMMKIVNTIDPRKYFYSGGGGGGGAYHFV
jgi:hypothetical protein